MKKIIAGVLALTLISCFVPFNNNTTDKYTVYAQGETEEDAEYTEGTYDVLTYRNYGDYIEISDCDQSAVEVEIPSEIDGVTVTSIDTGIFYFCYDLTSIKVSETNAYFSSIDGVLFNKDLTTILRYPAGKTDTEYVIPDSVTSIDNNAFTYSKNLTSVTIPSGVTSIGTGVFSHCTALESVTIPDSVKTIEDSAFYNCRSLTSVTIPDGVTSIGNATFANCYALTSVTIPDSVTNIGNSAFSYCKSLESVTIPDSVTNIGAYAFDY